MGLQEIARSKAVMVSPDAPVREVVRLMSQNKTGAVVVTKDARPKGIFTYRDLIDRVLLSGRSLETTPLSEVMTREVTTFDRRSSYGEALRLLFERDFTYLPVVDEEGRVLGLLSLRDLLQHQIEDLSHQLDSLENYLAVDGPGGD